MATLFKETRTGVTARRMTLEEVVARIHSKEYEGPLRFFRALCGTAPQKRNEDGTYQTEDQWEMDVPRICFAAEYKKLRGAMQLVKYHGLVMLEVGGLMNQDEAAEVRNYAGHLAQTVLSFVGADGRSVVIVCRAELPGSKESGGEKLPTDDKEMEQFHRNAYEMARQFYTGELHMSIDARASRVDRVCYMSADAELVYNPKAMPFSVDAEARPSLAKPRRKAASDEVFPGYDLYRAQVYAVQACLSKAFDDAVGIEDEQEWLTAVLSSQARYCVNSRIPMSLALRFTLHHGKLKDEGLLAEKIFDNAYTPSAIRKAARETKTKAVLSNIPPSTLLVLHIEEFLKQNYEFRKNEMTGAVEYRSLAFPLSEFKNVMEEDLNTITLHAKKAGLLSWDKDIQRYVKSLYIPRFNPIEDYLEQLPVWDGRDRLADLASRVPTNDELWPRMLRIWMRSMVVHWMGRDRDYGNALVPLLIGPQGCGKTTFCRLVLPEELREYYNDEIDFKKKFDLLNTLCSFVLVNLDEFDSITLSHQPKLKQLLSKADVKIRELFHTDISCRRRYASFIATTNSPQPLSDPSGSRRFFCVDITGMIDNTTPIEYEQLYAQLLSEIEAGERYWLTDEENRELMEHNAQYQQLDSLEEMVRASCFRPDPNDRTAEYVAAADILNFLVKKYRGLENSKSNGIKLGKLLKKFAFEKKAGRNNNSWKVRLE